MTCTCPCRCHVGGAFLSCDTGTTQPGGGLSCSPCNEGRAEIGLMCPLPHGTDQYGQRKMARSAIGYLCRSHYARMESAVDEVGTLWCELNLVIDGSLPREATEKTRRIKSAEAPAPLDLTAVSLRDSRTKATRIERSIEHPDGDDSEPLPAVPHIIASWVLLVAEERPLTDTLPRGVVPQLALLAKHHDWIAATEWGEDYLLEMTELRKALASAVRDRRHRYIGRCRLPVDTGIGTCGGALLEENGTGVIKCADCRAQWVTAQEQARLAVSLESA